MGDAEPHHDVLQVQHVVVPLLGAGTAQGAGTQHVVSSDVPARDRAQRQETECPWLPGMHALLDLNLVSCCLMAKIILSATAIPSVLAQEFAELLDGNEMSLKCFEDLCLMGCKGAALL